MENTQTATSQTPNELNQTLDFGSNLLTELGTEIERTVAELF